MIENTQTRDSMTHLVGTVFEGADGYITNMEAAGQHQLVSGTELPADGPWPEMETLGFVRGEPVDGDDLFVHATLPEGWRKETTEHSMWSKVVDERGVERLSVFYKAAFYGRSAFCRINNVGRQLATRDGWGDGPVELPSCWSVLTAMEKREYGDALDADLADRREAQQYYQGDGLQRQQALCARLEAFIDVLIESENR